MVMTEIQVIFVEIFQLLNLNDAMMTLSWRQIYYNISDVPIINISVAAANAVVPGIGKYLLLGYCFSIVSPAIL